ARGGFAAEKYRKLACCFANLTTQGDGAACGGIARRISASGQAGLVQVLILASKVNTLAAWDNDVAIANGASRARFAYCRDGSKRGRGPRPRLENLWRAYGS